MRFMDSFQCHEDLIVVGVHDGIVKIWIRKHTGQKRKMNTYKVLMHILTYDEKHAYRPISLAST